MVLDGRQELILRHKDCFKREPEVINIWKTLFTGIMVHFLFRLSTENVSYLLIVSNSHTFRRKKIIKQNLMKTEIVQYNEVFTNDHVQHNRVFVKVTTL